jgi:hypothetical protein
MLEWLGELLRLQYPFHHSDAKYHLFIPQM